MDFETGMAGFKSLWLNWKVAWRIWGKVAQRIGKHAWRVYKSAWRILNKAEGGIGSPFGGFETATGTTISQFIKPMTIEFLRYVIKFLKNNESLE